MGWFLMVKTAIPTGLKYLCKCAEYVNPYDYRGSGVYWRKHLLKHNCTWTTEVLGFFTSKEILKEAGLYYSELWDVVASVNWANYIPEIGDGGPTVKGKIRAYNPDNPSEQKFYDNVESIPSGWIRGGPCWNKTPESAAKTRQFHLGRKRSAATCENMRNSIRRPRIKVECIICNQLFTKQNIHRHQSICKGI